MNGSESGKRARLGRITVAATALAVLLVVLTGAVAGGPGLTRGASPGQPANSALVPAALVNSVIDLNRSQSAGTYVPEYVALNNSTSLTKLPASLTVTAASCRWVSVANLTAPASPVSPFHNVEFANETSANASGTLLSHLNSFKVCGGSGVWINFVQWTFGIYIFTASGLAVTPAPKVVSTTYGNWSGTSVGPAAATYALSTTSALSLTVASNLSFEVAFSGYNTSGSCDVTGQVCSHTRYSFVSASNGSFVNTTGTLIFGTIGGHAGYARASAAYSNWTVGYASAPVSDNTAIGGFFEDTGSFFQNVFVQFWYLWILALLVVIVIALSVRDRRGSRR